MIIFFGPVGAGKSVQGQQLAGIEGWEWISTGNQFRASTDPEIQAILASGQLISSEQTYQVLAGALESNRHKQVILDGFPRTIEQAEWLLKSQTELDYTVDVILVVDVPKDEILTRLAGRGRPEDEATIIEKRLAIYHEETEPLLDFLAARGVRIVHVDGVGTPETIHERVLGEMRAANLL
jgi:adenylate kinase